MNNNKVLSLARLLEPEHKEEIESRLTESFGDLYDLAEGVRENVENLESLMDRILFGSLFGMPKK